jgi:hypothetical protein
MSRNFKPFLLLAPLALLGACTTMPSGPSMLVLPGSGKNFDQFRADDMSCRQYAQFQVQGASPNQAAVDSGVRSAAVGTALGAVAGAAINGRHGAGVGAGTGLLFGGMSGAGAGEVSGRYAQRGYDNAYLQCMYANGHRVPVAGGFSESRSATRPPGYQGASSGGYYPPPPNLPPAPSMPTATPY